MVSLSNFWRNLAAYSSPERHRILPDQGSLRLFWPPPKATQILRACLEDRECLRQLLPQWEQVIQEEPLAKRLTPWLASRAQSLGLKDGHPIFRVAQIYEEHRWLAYRDVVEQTLTILAPLQAPIGIARGPWLAEQYYDRPQLRHCHDLDLAIDPVSRLQCAQSLQKAGYRQEASNTWLHPGGLPIVFHPQSDWTHWQRVQVCGHGCLALQGSSLLDFLLLHAASRNVPWSWALDFAVVYRKHHGQPSPTAPRSLACLALLKYLQSQLGLEVEASIESPPSAKQWQRAWNTLRGRGIRRWCMLAHTTGWRERWHFLGWILGQMARPA